MNKSINNVFFLLFLECIYFEKRLYSQNAHLLLDIQDSYLSNNTLVFLYHQSRGNIEHNIAVADNTAQSLFATNNICMGVKSPLAVLPTMKVYLILL